MKKKVFRAVAGGGVTSAAGFVAAGIRAGIKATSKKLDLAIIASRVPAVAAGTFTTNQVKAAPVQVSQKNIRSSRTVAIVANSGNANACTGVTGIKDACEMAALAARAVGCKPAEMLVCSTGRIGRALPMDVIRTGIVEAAGRLDPDGGNDAAHAILTSDSRDKQVAVRLTIDGKTVTVGGCAKGAGMIDPLMATMLCFITTDAVIDKVTLRRCLREAVDQSFNRICVDGDMSTNDTVLCLANGLAGNAPLRSYHPKLDDFQAALNHVTLDLAKKIVADGEFVTKFVEVHVTGAASTHDAKIAAESVARSMLAKSAFYGGDPNWGRILCAVGYSGARVREELVDIYYEGLLAVKGGVTGPVPVAKLKAVAAKPSFRICIRLHLGQGEHTVYTTDLTEKYVNFNKSE